MENLLKKYEGGRIPPLIDIGHPENSLLNGEFVQTYQRGFTTEHMIPFAILIADQTTKEKKWENADYVLNELAEANWTLFCKKVRKTKVGEVCPGDKRCMEYDRVIAPIAERERRVIAYMCCWGMIDFAMPIEIIGEVIAIVLSGQRKPKEGKIWPKATIEMGGIIEEIKPDEELVDAWEESKKRITEVSQIIGIELQVFFHEIEQDAQIYHGFTIDPQKVQLLRNAMEKAGRHLSDLATKTYLLEKQSLVGWIRSEIAKALMPIGEEEASLSDFWTNLKSCLEKVSRLFGIGHILLITTERPEYEFMNLICQFGLSAEGFPLRKYTCWDRERDLLQRIMKIVEGGMQTEPLNLKEFQKLPVFGELYKQYENLSTQNVLVVPIVQPGIIQGFLVVGNPTSDGINILRNDDKEQLFKISQDLGLITGIFLMVQKLREAGKAQTDFIEAVSHDMRSPIQNIMVAADNLRQGRISPENVNAVVIKIVMQLERLNIMAQRNWILEQIRLKQLSWSMTDRVDIYQLMKECSLLLTDFAAEEGSEIIIEDHVKNLPIIQVDREMFRLMIINILHNAIKYSTLGWEIRISGYHDSAWVTIKIGNRGIPIPKSEKEKIFEKYYRTKEAKSKSPDGTGVGLTLANEFIKHYNGRIEVESKPILGSRDYLTIFAIFIPRG